MPGFMGKHSPRLRTEGKNYKDPAGVYAAAQEAHYTSAIGDAIEAELAARAVADRIAMLREGAQRALDAAKVLADYGALGLRHERFTHAVEDAHAALDLAAETPQQREAYGDAVDIVAYAFCTTCADKTRSVNGDCSVCGDAIA